ncbi:MAG: carboxy-S-adenosyl-L-methionine synthase CmoA [Alcanivoracaceae bacterium]|nr:carboxy-S-adenosyl-L-methionine synthase CmoA [Alcanivoracaceae bacterium]
MSDYSDRDDLYARERQVIDRFSFDESVVRVFPDMIKRSVPGYDTIIEMTGVLAARYSQPGSLLYDLGCSLGASTLAMASLVPHQDCRIIAVDNSAAMLASARQLMDANPPGLQVTLTEEDIRRVSFAPQSASVAVMNFTLQFVPRPDRDALLARLANALLPGGILVLSEKIAFADPQEDDLQRELHHAFKQNNGYSVMEISQKRNALENVLVPETLEEHRRRLGEAGFSQVHVWFRCFNFLSLVAVR